MNLVCTFLGHLWGPPIRVAGGYRRMCVRYRCGANRAA